MFDMQVTRTLGRGGEQMGDEQQGKATLMEMWEYKFIPVDTLSFILEPGGGPDFVEVPSFSNIYFNYLGLDGWEFVSLTGRMLIFKRRKP